MRPIRVAYFTPNITLNGVHRWITDLASHTDPARVEWAGCFVRSNKNSDRACVAEMARLMPIHCGDPSAWGQSWACREQVHYHPSFDDAALAAAEDADLILAWEMDERLAAIERLSLPIVLVSHSTRWYPQKGFRASHLAAISHVAAQPFRHLGETTILHSGVSIDRCLPRRPARDVRLEWGIGPSHKVIGSVGRYTRTKDHQRLSTVVEGLDYRHKAVFLGPGFDHSFWRGKQNTLWAGTGHVGDFLGACDLLFSGSWDESFGQSVVEAWAAGVPTLVPEGFGVVPEFEAAQEAMSWKYPRDIESAELGQYMTEIIGDPDLGMIERAREYAQTHLSAGAMAARWERYFESLTPRRVRVVPKPRELRTRWRTSERPIRAVLYCQTLTDELQMALNDSPPDVVWQAAVVVTPGTTRPGCRMPIVTGPDGPGWAERHPWLAAGFWEHAKFADVVVLHDVPLSDAAIQTTTAPTIDWGADLYDRLRAAAPPAAVPDCRPLKALMLCPHVGFGGIERWMQSLFAAQDTGVEWVGVCALHPTTPNPELAKTLPNYRHADPQGTVGEKFATPEAAVRAAVDAHQPDVIVFWGLSTVGRYFPPNYQGPVVAVSHGCASDPWTRDWLHSSSSFVSHAAAVSYLAAEAFPLKWHEAATVIYPGIDTRREIASRAEVRARLKLSNTDTVVCYVGRADEYKRPDRIVEALLEMPRSVKFVHVGSTQDDPAYLERLRQLLPNRHVYVPHCDNDDEIIAASDLLVLRSKAESVGLVLLKALRYGVHVIAPEQSIVGELARDQNWASLWQHRDDGDLAQQIRDVLYGLPVSGEIPELVCQRFDEQASARNFADYLKHVVTTPLPSVPLYSLESSGTLQPRGQAGAVAVDVVMALTDDAAADFRTIQSLLKQRDATLFLHVAGSHVQIGALERSVGERARLLSYPEKHGLNPLLAAADFRTEAVLLAVSGDYYEPTRAVTTVNELLGKGAEIVMAGDPELHGSYTLRVGTVIDMLLTTGLPALAANIWNTPQMRPRIRQGQDFGARTPQIETSLVELPGWVEADVVLPFRDQTGYAREAIESVLAMEQADLVLHLIDDCSRDAHVAAALLTRYAGRHGRCEVKTYRTTRNVGQFIAVNGVVPFLEHEFLMIHDGDDVSRPHRATLSISALRRRPAGIFAGAVQAFGADLRMVTSSYPYPGNWYHLINPTVSLRRSEFERLGGYSDFGSPAANKTSLDTDFSMRAVSQGGRIQITASPVVAYRQHKHSCTASRELMIGGAIRTTVEAEIARRSLAGTQPLRGALTHSRELVKPFRT